jgi:hypothetical protein
VIAEAKAAAVDKRLQALERRIHGAWALLRAPAVSPALAPAAAAETPSTAPPGAPGGSGSGSGSSVVPRGRSLLAVVASVVRGAHVWEKHAVTQLQAAPPRELDLGSADNLAQTRRESGAASRFFSDKCAPLADCARCFPRHGPAVAETLRLLTAEASASAGAGGRGGLAAGAAVGPSHAAAATLLLRLQRDLSLTAAAESDAASGDGASGGSCGCARELVAALVATLPRENDEAEAGDGSSTSRRQTLTSRCQQALLALEVRLFFVCFLALFLPHPSKLLRLVLLAALCQPRTLGSLVARGD